jgi:hypothetical protein
MSWVGKDTLFRWPLGALFRALGGIPVDRSGRTGVIAQLSAELARRESLLLVIAPEGTRARTDHWRTGFYHLALSAGVPLGLGFIDFKRRRLGITEWVQLSGDPERDLARLRDFYADKTALRPEQAGEIRFLD